MARPYKFRNEDIEKALRATGGVYSLAAQWLTERTGIACSGQTVANYVRRSTALQKAESYIKGEVLDMAEAKLLQMIRSGNITAVIFYLKTKGKDRGYNERAEVTGKDGGPIEHKVVDLEAAIRDAASKSPEELARIYHEATKASGGD